MLSRWSCSEAKVFKMTYCTVFVFNIGLVL